MFYYVVISSYMQLLNVVFRENCRWLTHACSPISYLSAVNIKYVFDDFLCFVNRSTCMNFLKTNRCLVVTFIPLHTTSNVIPFWDANTKRLGARQASCGVLYKQIRSFKVFLMTKIFLLTKKYNEKKKRVSAMTRHLYGARIKQCIQKKLKSALRVSCAHFHIKCLCAIILSIFTFTFFNPIKLH